MEDVFVEIKTSQGPKRAGMPCGDVVVCERTNLGTTIIVCDGIGSGVKANIFATMCAARLKELLDRGFSLRKAFSNVVNTMNQAPGKDLPFAAFTLARILPDGNTTVLSYEMPAPILVSFGYASVLPQQTSILEERFIGESNCELRKGEGLILVSDGITQAGLGHGLAYGWEIEGLNRYINELFRNKIQPATLPDTIRFKARELCKGKPGDDATVVLAYAREGRRVDILTGAPIDPEKDSQVVADFMAKNSVKIVCGGTTAKILSRELKRPLRIEEEYYNPITPPYYMIDGIDLVTEGAVTLNQLYNIWDVERDKLDKKSPVTEFYDLLKHADQVNFMIGGSINAAVHDISYKQMHILPRNKIIPLLAAKLEKAGKLVSVEMC